jgi:exopolysaccharide production protein ExoQ
MPPQAASLLFILIIAGLYVLDRDRDAKTSKALWIPVIWMAIAGSRALAEWMAALGWGTPISQADAYSDGSPLDRNVLTALLVLGIIVLVRRKRFTALLLTNIPILLFFLYSALSVMWSDYPDITIKRWIKDLGDLVMVMVVVTDPDWYFAIKRFLVRVGFLLIPDSILVIKYYPAIGRSYNRWTWIVSFTGVTTHKDLLGRVCLIFGIAFVWCFLVAWRDKAMVRRARHMLAHGAAIAMVVWLFVMANSVTAQSCLMLAAAFLFVSGSGLFAARRWAVHALVAVCIALPLSTTLLGIGGSALEEMGRDATLTGRTVIWDQVLAETHNPILGAGFESFWLGDRLKRIQSVHPGLNESHNGFVEIYISLGLIGVSLLAIIIVTGYRNIMSSLRFNPDIGRLRMAYFIAAIVLSFTEAGFRMLNTTWITFLLAVMVTPEERSRRVLRDDVQVTATVVRRRVPAASAALSRV